MENKKGNFGSIGDKFRDLIAFNREKLIRYALPAGAAIVLFIIAIVRNVSLTAPDIVKSGEPDDPTDKYQAVGTMYVDISGAVMNPGVYLMEENSRLFHLIEKAGGLSDDALIDGINRAEELFDGEKIVIPSKSVGETAAAVTGGIVNGRVSINSADVEALETLPGIGYTKAQRIIDYRALNGRFKKLEDLKNVSGIGDEIFAGLKDLITL